MAMEMNIDDVVSRLLTARGLKVVKGSDGMGGILYPYLLMDLEYSVWQRDIRGVRAERELKKARTQWTEAYDRFNRAFFRDIGEDCWDYMCDLMDEYERWMERPLMLARVAIMNAIGERDFEEQKILSACLLCNCLAQCANIIWGTIYLDGHGRRRKNDDIERVEWASKAFADTWMLQRGDKSVINLNGDKGVNDAMNVVVQHITQFPAIKLARDLQADGGI